MIMREKRDINPVLFKIGIISAFSLIGIFYSIFNSRRTNKPSGSSSAKAPSSPENQSDQSDSGMAKDELRSADDDFLPKTFDFGNSDLIVPVEDEESPSHSRGSVDSFTNSYPSSNESTCDKNVYLLPDFNEFFKEHDLAVIKDSSTSMENAENMPNPYEVEIMGLRSTIKTLNERIRSLEMKLLEYQGIKEQESYVMELQNRLKINHMESKILHFKIKALMAEKKRLEEQMADYSKVALELETAKSKINVLEKELKREGQQNKGYLLALRDRVSKLQDVELKAFSNSEVELMVQKTKDLEEEIEELKKTNQSLEEENSALSHKVEYLQNFATSALEDEQVEEAVKKECIHLRQKNEELASQIERLESAHCTDVEELVYLRWINACLRYELRNHTPDETGKTAARDLSRSLSPKSEEKAKKLILEYAQKEGLKKDKAAIISIADFDLEQWSSHSYLTEDSDHEGDDDSSLDLSSTNHSDITRNSKIFGKLMRLVRGKQGQNHRQSTNSCFDNEVRRCSSDIPNCKLSLDLEKIAHFHFQESRSRKGEKSNDVEQQQQRCQRNSHDGSSYIYRVVGTTISGHEDDQHNRRLEDGSKAELVKYAEALKGSSNQKTPVRRRAASCSSFKHL